MKAINEHDREYVCDIHAPCFQKLNESELQLIKSSKTQVLFKKGETLAKQGAFASYILFVVNGICRQYIEGPHDKTYTVKIIEPGEFIGLSSVFNESRHNYSAVALTDCHMFLVEKDPLRRVIETNGSFGLSIVERYCSHNGDLYKSLSSLLFKNTNGRVAQILLYLNSLKGDHPDIFKLLSRKEIADFSAVSLEGAVKILKSFERDGFIKLIDKDILVVNEESLREVALRG